MKRLLSLGIALSLATVLVAVAQASTSSQRTLVSLRKTALGAVLVDPRGRTLYLFEKDRNGVSACDTACVKFWPALTSGGTPRAGNGVHQSLLRLTARSQVTYAGHPLYTFVGDKRSGQTSGEGLTNFGAGWYVVAASGQKVEQAQTSGSGYSSGTGYGSGGW